MPNELTKPVHSFQCVFAAVDLPEETEETTLDGITTSRKDKGCRKVELRYVRKSESER